MATVADTERQERRKKAGELLRMADKFFKFGDFEEADRLAVRATEADPGNPYAQAYRERIKFALEAGAKKQQQLSSTVIESPEDTPQPEAEPTQDIAAEVEAIQKAEEDVRHKLEEAQRKLEEERRRYAEEAVLRKEAEEKRRKEEESREQQRAEDLKKAT